MKDKYTAVYARKSFKVDKAADVAELGLAINYDDAFIAYINGREVLRVGITSGAGKGVIAFRALQRSATAGRSRFGRGRR